MHSHDEAPLFQDRIDAGRRLAAELSSYVGRHDVVVVGLPRGGVPVAAQVAAALGAPLDVRLVRKLGLPGNEEFAMGAIATGGVVDWNEDVLHELSASRSAVRAVIDRELAELDRRQRAYRGGRISCELRGKVVILVDDGLATGSSMRAAAVAVRREEPARLIVAAPVCSRSACASLERFADEVVCVATPEPLLAVGRWYVDFRPTRDDEVTAALEKHGARNASSAPAG